MAIAPEHACSTLPNGVRVISERMDALRSIALGFFIGAGSVSERPAEAGVSHLLEHMLFRGTASYSSSQIDALFDELGAGINAETDKESTVLSARFLDSHLERALPVMAEMVFAPLLSDVAAERDVVLQEISAYEDDPTEQVFERFSEALFGAHPLGRPVIGTRESVSALDEQRLRSHHARSYGPAQIVVAAAGSLQHEQLLAALERALAGVAAARAEDHVSAEGAPEPIGARVLLQRKETEQYHLCIGARGLARSDERRYALRVLEVILGSTPSSRLFQEVRERRGLAYAVYTFSSLYGASGELGVYLGTRPENLAEALAVTLSELQRIAGEEPSAEELRRARECAKSAAVLALESSGARMGRLGASTLFSLPLLTIDELIARIDAVSSEDCRALAAELLAPERLCVAAIGPDEETLAEALVPLHEQGAGAPSIELWGASSGSAAGSVATSPARLPAIGRRDARRRR
ncbi:MAG TPA: pitrilysin family protein [Solirubrobacteraceae bacterium]|nr:pitrilysin family protein [Solirubrobacteraceae bacterium]